MEKLKTNITGSGESEMKTRDNPVVVAATTYWARKARTRTKTGFDFKTGISRGRFIGLVRIQTRQISNNTEKLAKNKTYKKQLSLKTSDTKYAAVCTVKWVLNIY